MVKTLILVSVFGLFCVRDVFGEDFSHSAKFVSPAQFLEAARNFHPARNPTEFGYIFSASEGDLDDDDYGKTVFAETITEATELSHSQDCCVFFLKAEPKTEYTRSFVAALIVLRPDQKGSWRVSATERFQASCAGGWIECKVSQKPSKLKGTPQPIFRVTEFDAGRHDVFAERTYSLTVGGGVRLQPVN